MIERRAVIGYEGFYEVDENGQVYSLDRISTGKNGFQKNKGKILKPINNKKTGYQSINLSKNGKGKKTRLHRIVAFAFLLNPENKPYVNHKDADKHNNAVSNLEWCTHEENTLHAMENDLVCRGERNGANKIKDHQVKEAFDRAKSGEFLMSLAKEFNINCGTLNKAFNRVMGCQPLTLSEKRSRGGQTKEQNKKDKND